MEKAKIAASDVIVTTWKCYKYPPESGISISKWTWTFHYRVKGQASPLPAGWCCLKPKRRGRKYNFEIKVYMASGVVTLCRDFCLEFLHKILVLKIFPLVHFSLHFLPSWSLSLFSGWIGNWRKENHNLKILLNKVYAFLHCRLNILITCILGFGMLLKCIRLWKIIS